MTEATMQLLHDEWHGIAENGRFTVTVWRSPLGPTLFVGYLIDDKNVPVDRCLVLSR